MGSASKKKDASLRIIPIEKGSKMLELLFLKDFIFLNKRAKIALDHPPDPFYSK